MQYKVIWVKKSSYLTAKKPTIELLYFYVAFCTKVPCSAL
jgi:hypothetical protein